jgi:tetraacyldisaccharide 4'-kinase
MHTQRVRPLLSSATDSDSQTASHSFLLSSADQPLAAFCAIGNAQSFFAHLARDGCELVYTRAFNDHHSYTQNEIDDLVKESQERGARALITTAKDAVKLRPFSFSLPCLVVDVALKFDDENKLRDIVNKTINHPFKI